MSKIARYTGNLRAFGSNAQGLERTLFGETSQADDLTSQVTAAFLRGWGIVGPSENPSMEDFNAAMYTMSQFIAYQHQMGVPEWDSAQEYYIGSLCVRAGETYASLANSNINSAPPSAKWTQVITVKNGLTSLGIADANGYVGRLINIQVFTSSGTYTKTPGAKKARARSLGGGGAGGGTEVTTSSQIAAAWGGNSGAYAESTLIDISSVTSVAVTIGAAGIPASGAAGGAGGQSSFGSYLITPGGAGGLIGQAGAGISAGVDMDTGANPSGSALAFGTPASVGVGPLSLSATVGQGTMKSGRGADSKLGVGGGGIRGANTAKAAFGYGAGGGGSAVGPSAATTTSGGNGTSGIIIVEEYA